MHLSTTPFLSQTISPRWVSIQFLSHPIDQTLLPVTFGYSLSSEAVVMRQLRRWKRLWRRSLTRSHKRTSMGPSRSFWNGRTSALQPEEVSSKETRVSCVYYQWKCPYEKSLETYLMNLVYLGYQGFSCAISFHITNKLKKSKRDIFSGFITSATDNLLVRKFHIVRFDFYSFLHKIFFKDVFSKSEY